MASRASSLIIQLEVDETSEGGQSSHALPTKHARKILIFKVVEHFKMRKRSQAADRFQFWIAALLSAQSQVGEVGRERCQQFHSLGSDCSMVKLKMG